MHRSDEDPDQTRPGPWNRLHGPTCAPRSGGAVLVLVLVSLLLFSTVVLQVTQQAVDVHEEHTLLIQTVHAGFQAEAGMRKALELISGSTAGRGEPGQPLPLQALPVWQEDHLRITILPTNAKLNLNALHPPSHHPQAMRRMQEGVARLLAQAGANGLSGNAKSEGDLRDILLWLGKGYDPDRPETARVADSTYAGIQPEYLPRKGPLERPEELLLVHGYLELDPAWVRERFTVWGQDSRVNLNLAEKEVILALAPELEAYWPTIQRHRAEQGFQRLDELISRIRLPMDIYQRVLPHLALDADTLEILVEVRQPAWYEQHRIIVERPSILTDSPPKVLARDIIESRPLEITATRDARDPRTH